MKGEITRRVAARYWLAAFGLFFFAQWSAAASSEDLGLQEAIQRTLADNPGLMAYGYQVEAQQGQVTQSEVKPGLELGVEVENVLGTGDHSGIKGSTTTLSLGWVLERGKRPYYIGAARAGVSVLQAEAAIARLDAVALTARLFFDNLQFQEQFKVAQEAIAMAEQTVKTANRRVQYGRAPTADRARAEAELAMAKLAAFHLEHELATSRHRLAAQWGQAKPAFKQVTGNWRQLPEPGSFASLLEQVARFPDLSIYLSRRRLREAELQLARTKARPDWRVDAGVRRLEQADDYAFVAGISIPLTTPDRNRGRVAEARANLALVDAESAATRVQIEAQLFALYQELQHSLHNAEILQDEVLPRLQEAAAQTRKGYEAGRYSLSELQQLQSTLLATRTGVLEAAVDARRHQVEIERLTGAPMPSAVQ